MYITSGYVKLGDLEKRPNSILRSGALEQRGTRCSEAMNEDVVFDELFDMQTHNSESHFTASRRSGSR